MRECFFAPPKDVNIRLINGQMFKNQRVLHNLLTNAVVNIENSCFSQTLRQTQRQTQRQTII